MPSEVIRKIQRGLRKPPGYIARRLVAEGLTQGERFFGIRRGERFNLESLLAETGDESLSLLWQRLVQRPYLSNFTAITTEVYEQICQGDGERIRLAAARAMRHEVDLMGSGSMALGDEIDWHKDYKTGFRWAPRFFKDIDYNNPSQPSDVKFAWELSRVQWLIPVGQAFLLTKDERYAEFAKKILANWIRSNPYASTVNWSVTMETAMRIFTWTWLFYAFSGSQAWSDPEFQAKFLCALYLHGDFTDRHIERSDINGNHYAADASALVVAGLFFGAGRVPKRWETTGWSILQDELPTQVFADGVDFEASIPYHRLVMELFLLPVLYLQRLNRSISSDYKKRLMAMADFVAAYSRPDGTSPVWGDNDDARTLPFGGQALNDHRYLLGIAGTAFETRHAESFDGSVSEVFWYFGADAANRLRHVRRKNSRASTSFPEGGFFIMQNEKDHVFIDCGPIGLAGRGGHGHNDILSFEAVLDDECLIVDCGCYVYTASYEERNNFRSTAYHNTPTIGGEEVNRFIRPEYLWNMHYDAVPNVREWKTGKIQDLFVGAHSGYSRLNPSVTPVRTIILEHQLHSLTIVDRFEGSDAHELEIPLHLATGVEVSDVRKGAIRLTSRGKNFHLTWDDPTNWPLEVTDTRISPRYGVVLPSKVLRWRSSRCIPFQVRLLPEK